MITYWYEILNGIGLIVALIILYYAFNQKNKSHNREIRLIATGILFIINLIEIPIAFQAEREYLLSIVIILLCFVYVLLSAIIVEKKE